MPERVGRERRVGVKVKLPPPASIELSHRKLPLQLLDCCVSIFVTGRKSAGYWGRETCFVTLPRILVLLSP